MGFKDQLKKIDSFFIGLSMGIIVPLVLFTIFQPLDRENFSFMPDRVYNQTIKEILPMILSRCIFPNAFLFFICMSLTLDKLGKGLLFSTTAMVVVLLLIQFVF